MTSGENTDDDPPFAWPTTARAVFSPDAHGPLNSCVGHTRDLGEMYVYAVGYRRAAAILCEHVVGSRDGRDTIVFPAIFLWRQYLELQLKDIIVMKHELAEEADGFPKHHRLDRLWSDARKCIVSLGTDGADEDTPELRAVDAVINQFTEVDPYADGFRYPHTRDGKPVLEGVPPLVSMRIVLDVMDGVANFLDAVHTELRGRVDWTREQNAESDRW